MKPIALLEGPKHCKHQILRTGAISLMPGYRMVPWPDSRVPEPYGATQNGYSVISRAIINVWKDLPEDRRYLHLVAGLSRSIDQRFPADYGKWPPSDEDILRGILEGSLACDQDISICSQLAKMLRSAGMNPAGIWIDAECWPTRDAPQYKFICDTWDRLKPGESVEVASRNALWSSACIISDALGWRKNDVITAACQHPSSQRGQHWWSAQELPPTAPPKTYIHIDPTQSPEKFRSDLQIAADRGVKAVFIFGEDCTAEQLASHYPALRDLCEPEEDPS